MRCVFCGGQTSNVLTTFSYEDGERYFLVEHVPAEVCGHCGEKTYAPEVTDELLKFSQDRIKPIKKLEVPVFDFAEVS